MQKSKPQTPFLWGAAISAHQTEGMNVASDWWAFEQNILAKRGISPSGMAADHWHRYREDIDFLANAGLNAFRFSIEWAKVEPEEGRINEAALRHYDDVMAYATSKGIHICLTLWHFTLPAWAAAKGGILSHDVRIRFLRYVERCAKRYATSVDLWQTMNEPMVYIMEGYRWGHWPPCIRSKWMAVRSFFALRSMHRDAYGALKRAGIERAGIAKSVIAYLVAPSASLRWMRVIRQKVKHSIWNNLFFAGTAHLHDFIAINYYITDMAGSKPDGRPRDDMGWGSYPEGLASVIRWAAKMKKPVYMTENGIATNDDAARIVYLNAHLDVIKRAQKDGLAIKGYFHWSLLDNFEWDKGFSKRFGLVTVDQSTYDRKPKKSLSYLGAHAKQQ